MSGRIFSACLILLLSAAPAAASTQARTLLLRQPAVSSDHVAFVHAGDIWLADRHGANPRRLTSDRADERRPHFSPDGRLIAFTAEYGGNTDVYVIEAGGGAARRVTFHPGNDEVSGWSSDGRRITFSSAREVGNGRSGQLFEVALDGGFPSKVMEAPFFRGAWNGDVLAYMPFGPAYNGLYGGTSGWRGYRGGTTPPILLLEPSEGRISRVPAVGAISRCGSDLQIANRASPPRGQITPTTSQIGIPVTICSAGRDTVSTRGIPVPAPMGYLRVVSSNEAIS